MKPNQRNRPPQTRVSKTLATGRTREDQAAAFLRDLGYTIVARNYRSRWAEIDIVALDGEILVFVEVRYRKDGHAEESVGMKKLESLKRAAQLYRTEMDTERDYRFDLIAIDDLEIRHHVSFA